MKREEKTQGSGCREGRQGRVSGRWGESKGNALRGGTGREWNYWFWFNDRRGDLGGFRKSATSVE